MSLSGAARLAGIVGWPVTQSLSPRLHGYWLRQYGIDGAVVPLPVRRADFARVLDGLIRAGFAGVNVTVPHKEAAFALAHEADAAAQAAGAANLLLFRGGRVVARNTDAEGLRAALHTALDGRLKGRSVVLLGAGGAARGAVLALAALGVARIRLLARDAGRARALAGAVRVDCEILPGTLADWPGAAADAALAVNATSAGMGSNPPLGLALEALPAGAAVCDMVYHPLKTDLLKRAEARGLPALDGLGMLMHQAVPSFEGFFGIRPQVTPALRAALERALA